jgi:hypothetical protein
MHRAFMRSAVLDVTPIIPATACHQSNDVERYSRFRSTVPQKSSGEHWRVRTGRGASSSSPFPQPPRENRAYDFHHTTAHAGRTSVGSSFAGFFRCIPPDSHPVSRPITTASRLRRFPLCAALPRSAMGRYSHEYYHRSATSHTPGFGPYLALFPPGRFPFRDLFRLGLWRVQPGSPLAYSPLSFTSRARLPVSSPMDSATWFRWWFAAIPYRALRLPARNRGKPGGLSQPSSGPM